MELIISKRTFSSAHFIFLFLIELVLHFSFHLFSDLFQWVFTDFILPNSEEMDADFSICDSGVLTSLLPGVGRKSVITSFSNREANDLTFSVVWGGVLIFFQRRWIFSWC